MNSEVVAVMMKSPFFARVQGALEQATVNVFKENQRLGLPVIRCRNDRVIRIMPDDSSIILREAGASYSTKESPRNS